jgi:hypothetical protein
MSPTRMKKVELHRKSVVPLGVGSGHHEENDRRRGEERE